MNPNNGWQTTGKVLNWALDKLQGNEFQIYMTIVRMTVGYNQTTSELLSYTRISELTGISLRTIKRTIPKLIKSKYIIKLATNQVENIGKLPYRYQLNFKLPGFPSLGNLTKQDGGSLSKPKLTIEQEQERLNLTVTKEGNLIPIFDESGKMSHEWSMYKLDNPDYQTINPTVEQYLKYKSS